MDLYLLYGAVKQYWISTFFEMFVKYFLICRKLTTTDKCRKHPDLLYIFDDNYEFTDPATDNNNNNNNNNNNYYYYYYYHIHKSTF